MQNSLPNQPGALAALAAPWPSLHVCSLRSKAAMHQTHLPRSSTPMALRKATSWSASISPCAGSARRATVVAIYNPFLELLRACALLGVIAWEPYQRYQGQPSHTCVKRDSAPPTASLSSDSCSKEGGQPGGAGLSCWLPAARNQLPALLPLIVACLVAGSTCSALPAHTLQTCCAQGVQAANPPAASPQPPQPPQQTGIPTHLLLEGR